MNIRLLSVDILRSIAILMMVQTHFVANYARESSSLFYNFWIENFGAIFSAPSFSFLVGLSYWLWYQKNLSLGKSEKQIIKMSCIKGSFLFLFSFIFWIVVWLPLDIFSWDILSFLGASMIIIALMRKAPISVFIISILVVLAISPTIRELTDYASHWHEKDYYDYGDSYGAFECFMGFLSHGYFGLLPWICFPFMGFAVGKQFFNHDKKADFTSSKIAFFALALMAIGYGGAQTNLLPNFTGEMTFYPGSTTYIVGYMGNVLLAIWLLHKFVDNAPNINVEKFKFFTIVSKFSLTIYMLHHITVTWSMFIRAILNDKITGEDLDDFFFYENDMSNEYVAWIIAISVIIVFYFMLKKWDKSNKGKFSFEWCMRKLC